MYIHICIYTCIYTCIHVCMHTYIYIWIYNCIIEGHFETGTLRTHTQQSPKYTQKSPTYTQKSLIYTQKSLTYTQPMKTDAYTTKRSKEPSIHRKQIYTLTHTPQSPTYAENKSIHSHTLKRALRIQTLLNLKKCMLGGKEHILGIFSSKSRMVNVLLLKIFRGFLQKKDKHSRRSLPSRRGACFFLWQKCGKKKIVTGKPKDIWHKGQHCNAVLHASTRYNTLQHRLVTKTRNTRPLASMEQKATLQHTATR